MNRHELRIAARGIREGNSRYAGAIIQFLDKDEYRFGSGYAKEYAWKMLKRADLTEKQKEQLRNIALRYLQKRMQREFWYMCRFIHRIADEAFRARVKQLSASKDEKVRQRAALLLAYFESSEKGEQAHHEFRWQGISRKYRF